MKKKIVSLLIAVLLISALTIEASASSYPYRSNSSDEWPVIVILLAFAAVVVIYIFAATTGGHIAEEKGFSFGKYTFLCIFVPIIGFILVAALPDRGSESDRKLSAMVRYLEKTNERLDQIADKGKNYPPVTGTDRESQKTENLIADIERDLPEL